MKIMGTQVELASALASASRRVMVPPVKSAAAAAAAAAAVAAVAVAAAAAAAAAAGMNVMSLQGDSAAALAKAVKKMGN